MKFSLAVVGSRSFRDYELLSQWIDFAAHYVLLTTVEIVSGGARGADRLARKWAEDNGVTYKEYPAEWDHYGKRAGMVRNLEIVARADTVLAFWDGKSTGTKDTINKAVRAKKPVIIVPFGGRHEDNTRLLFD